MGNCWTSAQRRANELGVNGFVRNETDGTVFAEIEGEEEIMKTMIAWCREGPPFANVSRVEVVEGDVAGHAGFDAMMV